MKKKINVTLDEETIKQIDEARDLIPRSSFINNILKNYLKEKQK